MKKEHKDILILGIGLFAMFFGAGNLIFPPYLGMISGKSWLLSGIGFFITAIGMPLLGIIATAKSGGTIFDIGNKVSSSFSKIFASVIVLSIGPLLAIPRTGATTYELGIKPLFPNVSSITISIIFFGLTLYFVIKPSEVVDKIAKILTPLLLLTIFIIIFKGIVSPIGTPKKIISSNIFYKGFSEGYQTMDALASLVFGGVILTSIIGKGYTNTKQQVNLTIKSGAIAALGLALVYGGLIYVGASSSSTFPDSINKTDLLIGITDTLLGNYGKIALAIVVSLACLTTAIGLTATVGSFFNKLSNGKIDYKIIVIFTCIFSGIFANIGVQTIVNISVPLLVAVYPIAIVLIIMNIFDDYMPKAAYIGTVVGAMFVSLYDGLSAAQINISLWGNILKKMPLSSAGFGWIIPSLLGGIIAVVFSHIIRSLHTANINNIN